MVLTPGPNMMYCVSRTLCQGRTAGLVSLAGVQLGLVLPICAAGAGLTALLLALPMAFNAIKLAGAALCDGQRIGQSGPARCHH